MPILLLPRSAPPAAPAVGRIHGRRGVAYLSLTSGAAASPVAFLSDWTVDYTRNVFDVTSILDAQHIYAAGTVDASGSFTGFFDTATAQTYTAAIDGLPRNLYLYPSAANTGQFFTGLVVADFNAHGGVAEAVGISVSWVANGPFIKAG